MRKETDRQERKNVNHMGEPRTVQGRGIGGEQGVGSNQEFRTEGGGQESAGSKREIKKLDNR